MSWVSRAPRLVRVVRRRRMRPYGQERVYGKGLWTARFHYGAKIFTYMPVKNRKRERALPIDLEEYGESFEIGDEDGGAAPPTDADEPSNADGAPAS